MESLLSGSKLADELAYMKTFAAVLATQKVVIPSNYVPPVQDRPKRPALVNVQPSPASSGSTADTCIRFLSVNRLAGSKWTRLRRRLVSFFLFAPRAKPKGAQRLKQVTATEAQISITVKSSKPAISVTLECSPTSTIASLKQALVQKDSSAPAPEAQRWILKGKAMSDTKLLKEFDVQSGAVVNLMVSKSVPAAASSSSTSSDDPPAVVLTTESGREKPAGKVAEGGASSGPSAAESEAFVRAISDASLWKDTLEQLKARFSNERDAVKVWEAWLSSSLHWMSASDKARIREATGVSAMGGQ